MFEYSLFLSLQNTVTNADEFYVNSLNMSCCMPVCDKDSSSYNRKDCLANCNTTISTNDGTSDATNDGTSVVYQNIMQDTTPAGGDFHPLFGYEVDYSATCVKIPIDVYDRGMTIATCTCIIHVCLVGVAHVLL